MAALNSGKRATGNSLQTAQKPAAAKSNGQEGAAAALSAARRRGDTVRTANNTNTTVGAKPQKSEPTKKEKFAKVVLVAGTALLPAELVSIPILVANFGEATISFPIFAVAYTTNLALISSLYLRRMRREREERQNR